MRNLIPGIILGLLLALGLYVSPMNASYDASVEWFNRNDGYLSLYDGCDVVDSYYYQTNNYFNGVSLIKNLGQSVLAVDQVCNTDYGTVEKTILLDLFSGRPSYRRVLTACIYDEEKGRTELPAMCDSWA